MARKYKSISTARQGVKAGRSSRIVIPQAALRSLRVTARNTVNVGKPDDPDFILHRRGLRRLKLDDDPRELRAISKDRLTGTLPERIVYKRLLQLGMKDGVDFTFQTSMQGGRMELGGIVADFVFPRQHLILQVQGPTHTTHIRMKKDTEQRNILGAMGYDVVEWTDELIYDEYALENEVRRTFGLLANWGSGGAYSEFAINNWMTGLFDRVGVIHQKLENFQGLI